MLVISSRTFSDFSFRATMPPSFPVDTDYPEHTQYHPSSSLRPRPTSHDANAHFSSDTSSSSSSSHPDATASLPCSSTKVRAPRFIDTFRDRILSKPTPHSPNSPSSPTFLTKPKRKRRIIVPDPRTKVLRSHRHNEAEVRRRQRLNDLLVDLAEAIECRMPQKSAILRVTLEKVKSMQRTIHELEEHIRRLEADKEHSAKAVEDTPKEVVFTDGFQEEILSTVEGNSWTHSDAVSGMSSSMGMGDNPYPLLLSRYSIPEIVALSQTLPAERRPAACLSTYHSSSAYASFRPVALPTTTSIKNENCLF
jgi:hypothetical protein